jgi:meiotically up-regulated gene 157 (Mug157) protein
MNGRAPGVTPHEQIPPRDPPLGPIREEFGTSVQSLTDSVYARLKDRHGQVAETFRKCFPTALATTTEILADGTTFVSAGDIPNCWPRDAAGSFEPYLPLCRDDARLNAVVLGLIRRLSHYLVLDPYANSFNPEANHRHYWPGDTPAPGPWIRERKWSIDTPAAFLKLAADLQGATGATDFCDEEFYQAARSIVDTFQIEQDHTGSSAYRFQRNDPDHPGDTLPFEGRGSAVKNTGMIWCGFRASDDPCTFGFNIPQNMLAVTVLSWVSGIFRDQYGDADYADRAARMSREVRQGIQTFGIVNDPVWGRIYAYETDGLGNHALMDDATPPNLLSAPLLGYAAHNDPTYQRTRAFVLSKDNPYFISEKYARGLGSAHPYNASPAHYIWHIGLITEGLSAPTQDERWRLIESCAATTGGTGFMHEAFDARDPARYIRGWCPWNTSQFGALVLSWLHRSQ